MPAHRKYPDQRVRIADSLPWDILKKFREVAREDKVLIRGDIIWLRLPQTLSSTSHPDSLSHKTRPFIVMDKEVKYQTDISGTCTTPSSLLGIGLSRKANLLPGRPRMMVAVPGQKEKSYAWFDTLRTVDINNIILDDPVGRLTEIEICQLLEGLDQTLRPIITCRFFVGKFDAGRFCNIRVKGMEETSALVLLHYPLNDREQKKRKTPHDHPPYLLAAFKSEMITGSLVPLRESEVTILPAFMESLANPHGFDKKNARTILNGVRRRAGLTDVPVAKGWKKAIEILTRFKIFPHRLGERLKKAFSSHSPNLK